MPGKLRHTCVASHSLVQFQTVAAFAVRIFISASKDNLFVIALMVNPNCYCHKFFLN